MGYRDMVIDSVSVGAAAVANVQIQVMENMLDWENLRTYPDGPPGKGSLLGQVFSKTTGQPLPYARIKLKETRLCAFTDREGEFISRLQSVSCSVVLRTDSRI